MTLAELTQPIYNPIISPPVTVESPQSVRSPTRSPRLSGLLFALKDVIGEDEEDTQEDAAEEAGPLHEESVTLVNESNASTGSDTLVTSFGDLTHVSEEAWTFLDGDSGSVSTSGQNVTTNDEDTVRLSHTFGNDEDNTQQSPIRAIQGSPEADQNSLTSDFTNYTSAPIPVTLDLLSPVDLCNFPLAPFVRPENREDSFIDSGYAETDSWISPSPHVLSPPRSPALTSASDLFFSPVRSPSSCALSQKRSASATRVPPSPLGSAFSSPRNNPVEIDDVPLDLSLELEDTPKSGSWLSEGEQTARSFGGPLLAEDVCPTRAAMICAGASPHQVFTDEEYEEEPADEHTFGPSAAAWDLAESEPTALFLGVPQDDPSSTMALRHSSPDESSDPARDDEERLGNTEMSNLLPEDVNAALGRFVSNPIHFLTSGSIDFVGDEAEQHSSLADASPGHREQAELISSSPSPSVPSDDSSEPESPPDFNDDDFPEISPTARLEYLSDQTLMHDGYDTLQSLYDIYSEFPSPEQDIHTITVDQQLEIALKTPTSSSFPRERVFTPPVGRSRSGTITTYSPNSLPSPRTSLPSPYRGHSSREISESAKVKGNKYPARSLEGEIGDVQEVEASRKVPFGFRRSFALVRNRFCVGLLVMWIYTAITGKGQKFIAHRQSTI